MPCAMRSSASRSTRRGVPVDDLGGGGLRPRRPTSSPRRRRAARRAARAGTGAAAPRPRRQLLRRADDEVVERLRLKRANSDVERVAEVVELLLLDRALVARLRPAALVVLAVRRRPRSGRPPRAPSAVPAKMRAVLRLTSSTHQRSLAPLRTQRLDARRGRRPPRATRSGAAGGRPRARRPGRRRRPPARACRCGDVGAARAPRARARRRPAAPGARRASSPSASSPCARRRSPPS